MKLQRITGIFIAFLAMQLSASAQTQEIHLEKLTLDKKEKKVFSNRDSSAILYIDTLIMKDKSSLQFFGKKNVKIVVKHAEIGNKVTFFGTDNKNNSANFDIDINFNQLGSLYVLAKGESATNGTRTYPNGNAGNVNITYDANGIQPQSSDKKAKNYVHVDVSPGGLNITPISDLRMIYSQIQRAPQGLRGVPQGQIYSGSPGIEGKVTIKSNTEK